MIKVFCLYLKDGLAYVKNGKLISGYMEPCDKHVLHSAIRVWYEQTGVRCYVGRMLAAAYHMDGDDWFLIEVTKLEAGCSGDWIGLDYIEPVFKERANAFKEMLAGEHRNLID